MCKSPSALTAPAEPPPPEVAARTPAHPTLSNPRTVVSPRRGWLLSPPSHQVTN